MARQKGYTALVVGEKSLRPADQAQEAMGSDVVKDYLLEFWELISASFVAHVPEGALSGVL